MPVLIDWEYNSSSQLISVTVDDDDDDYWTKRYHNYKENRCPNCGAIMDGCEKE